MGCFNVSDKCSGQHVEFGIVNPEQYTLYTLWADVYMFTCSTMPDPTEKFKAKVKIPWCVEYRVLRTKFDMQDVFQMFRERNVQTIRVNLELIPMRSLPPDSYAMQNNSSDEVEGKMRQLRMKPTFMMGKPFKQANNGKDTLEVGQMFNNLSHFRHVLRDFAV
ncbi:hypothetical protein Ddye_006873 [Dipteronia dyeriana]|uniref:Uncharacterized protein n=1 Tax=Dipteronia dyeriana TaxID=168575 RepID=A0AAE0CQY4_9ROSI|nr:hypothetical protein Ddye_006873 [Dipteronia dyeriana]